MIDLQETIKKFEDRLADVGSDSDLATHLKNQFFEETGLDIEDDLFDGKPFCRRLVCDQSRCRCNHLNWSVYCRYRYTCNNPQCEKKHYDLRRNFQTCYMRTNCTVSDCPLVHRCRYENRCNKPDCPAYHDANRNNNYCYADKRCRVTNCKMIHSCPTINCNNPSCKNPHRNRDQLKCMLGKKCEYADCEMSHTCVDIDDCKKPECNLRHSEKRRSVFCVNDSICRGKKAGTCELRHSCDTRSKSNIHTKKTVGNAKAGSDKKKKQTNVFAHLSN